MKRIYITIILVAISIFTIAQTSYRLTPSFESLAGTGENLPFWLTHNQMGRYPITNNPTQLLAFEGNIAQENLFNTPLTIEAGTNLIGSYSSDLAFQANELYAKAHLWGWKLEAGWFHEPEYFSGLSSTNGSMDRSNNARPYPRIRLGTNEFIPFLFWKNWFTFKAEYDEGWLNDERTVIDTKFHHKSLYLKANFTETMALSFGLNHYVMWGGFSPSPKVGQMPEGFKNYLIYITGSVGTEEFPETDRYNVAGNHLGTYRLAYNFSIGATAFELYINHPFEDHGGMELSNPQDNLYGMYTNFNKSGIVEAIVYEFMYTLYQSGDVHVQGSTGLDNYFNHGVYNNGYTYSGYTMASPLFTVNTNGVGHENNRILMHHIGAKGSFSKYIKWDCKLTYSLNYGTYRIPYDPIRNQFSSILNLNYHNTAWPVNLSLSLAADAGELYGNNFGGMIRVSRTFQ